MLQASGILTTSHEAEANDGESINIGEAKLKPVDSHLTKHSIEGKRALKRRRSRRPDREYDSKNKARHEQRQGQGSA